MARTPKSEWARWSLWVMLTLLLCQCGHDSKQLLGVWLLNDGPYKRELVQFEREHCQVVRWDLAKGRQTGDGEKISYRYDRSEGQITFMWQGETLRSDIVFFEKNAHRYFRLLFPTSEPEQEPPVEEQAPAQSGPTFLDKLKPSQALSPLVFRSVPDWVTKKTKFKAATHPLNGLWTHREGRGEDSCTLRFAMEAKNKGLMILNGEHPSIKPGTYEIQVNTENHPYQVERLNAGGNKISAFEFLAEDILQWQWTESETEQDTRHGSGLWRHRPAACAELLSETARISEVTGIQFRVTRPDVHGRVPSQQIVPLIDTHCASALEILPVMELALSKYPQDFLTRNLDEVILCEAIYQNQKQRDGLVQIYRGRRFFFFDINVEEPEYMFHHYLFQLVDAQYGKSDQFARKIDWLRVNALHGIVGEYNRTDTRSHGACYPDKGARGGFITELAKRGYGDDRAQTFAALMMDGGPCGTPKQLIADATLVDKSYLLYAGYPEVTEPVIVNWIKNHDLPDRRADAPVKPAPKTTPAVTPAVKKGPKPKPKPKSVPKTIAKSQEITPISTTLQEEAPVPIELPETKPEVETPPKKKPPSRGSLEIQLALPKGAKARRAWETVFYTLDGKQRALKGETKKHTISAGKHSFSLSSNLYQAIKPVTFQIVAERTTRIECTIKGRTGRKLTLTINGKTIVDDLKLSK